jgi:phage tail-like protein
MTAMAPIQAFRFEVTFLEESPPPGARQGGAPELCRGAFSECSGLEATMEPKVIREGGRNYGVAQRAGRVTFGTVVLRRGVTSNHDLWHWFELVSRGAYAYRLTATLTVRGPGKNLPPVLRWRLRYCIPTKFKAADAKATSNEVAIEELHLAHEGLELVPLPGAAP